MPSMFSSDAGSMPDSALRLPSTAAMDWLLNPLAFMVEAICASTSDSEA